jgi:hypothetical protein
LPEQRWWLGRKACSRLNYEGAHRNSSGLVCGPVGYSCRLLTKLMVILTAGVDNERRLPGVRHLLPQGGRAL